MVLASLGPFRCLHLLTVSIDCCTASYRSSCFTVTSIFVSFSEKGKIHVNQKRSSMNVCSAEGIFCCKKAWPLQNPSLNCALVWVVVEKRHNYIQMCFKAGNFIFLLKMYSMDVLCESKVVHVNTTLSAFFQLVL